MEIKFAHRLPSKRFLKGPVPMSWLTIAAGLPGKAIHASIAIWHLRYLTNSLEVKIGRKLMEELNLNRYALRRALILMKSHGLIEVKFARGKRPRVTIVAPD